MGLLRAAFGWVVAFSVVSLSFAADSENSLSDLSLEELMDQSVTSVSKKETRLVESATAIAVITSEDMRRIGAKSIPEALRMVPGLQVARINASEWAISARGFNSQYARSLLVLVDGRSVYTPAFSGVFWSTLDLMIEDVDRIEVIRGPGASLWGANAVNGVINVMTKSAKDTQGFLGNVTYGTDLQPLTNLRYGGQLGSNLYYRVYGQYMDHDEFYRSDGGGANDEWHAGRTGFRMDWHPSQENQLTLLGDYYRQKIHQPYQEALLAPVAGNRLNNDRNDNYGSHVLGRWSRSLAEDSELGLQLYWDQFKHIDAGTVERRDTFDVDGQHRFAVGDRHEITWGLGYRYSPDEIYSKTMTASWDPERSRDQLFSAFAQDEISLVKDRLRLTVGSKFEHNDYTGFEVQPSGRLIWLPTENQALWGAVSRATRTPSRFDEGGRINVSAVQPPFGPPVLVSLLPSEDLRSEEVIAYELGYRLKAAKRWGFDAAAFYNRYKDMSIFVAGSGEFEASPPPPHVLVPLRNEFSLSGETYGVELLAEYEPADWWRLTAGYTWLHMRMEDSVDDDNPEHQFSFRSYVDLTQDLELNGALYYVDQTFHSTAIVPIATPSYVRLDLGLAWRPYDWMELAVWGQNLLDDRHAEFFSFHTTYATEIPRGVFGKLSVRF